MKTDMELKCTKEKTAKRERSAGAAEDADGDGAAGTLIGLAVIGGAGWYYWNRVRNKTAVKAARFTMVPHRIATRRSPEPAGNSQVKFVPTGLIKDFKKIRL